MVFAGRKKGFMLSHPPTFKEMGPVVAIFPLGFEISWVSRKVIVPLCPMYKVIDGKREKPLRGIQEVRVPFSLIRGML